MDGEQLAECRAAVHVWGRSDITYPRRGRLYAYDIPASCSYCMEALTGENRAPLGQCCVRCHNRILAPLRGYDEYKAR